jgi:hypothetical protein
MACGHYLTNLPSIMNFECKIAISQPLYCLVTIFLLFLAIALEANLHYQDEGSHIHWENDQLA